MEEEGPRQVAFCSELRGSGETGESFFFFFLPVPGLSCGIQDF